MCAIPPQRWTDRKWRAAMVKALAVRVTAGQDGGRDSIAADVETGHTRPAMRYFGGKTRKDQQHRWLERSWAVAIDPSLGVCVQIRRNLDYWRNQIS